MRSGALNGVGAIQIGATALARESLYATIVDLVRSAEGNKAPLQRLADRYAIWFTPVVLVACAVAWFVSHDTSRVLAVLVVATPCPLILAAPVAIVGGINRATRRHIIVRTGAALEQVSRVNAVVFDKTGTLTAGQTRVATVRAQTPWTEDSLLALAAALEQHSAHQLARTTVEAAQSRGLVLVAATNTKESPGRGIRGSVGRQQVTLGSLGFIAQEHPGAVAWFTETAALGPGLRAFVVVDGHPAGSIEYADKIREGLPALMSRLRMLGVTKTMLVSGDDADNVQLVASHAGISDTRSEVLPAEKLNVVRELQRNGLIVAMLGDGTNDAPALAAADVGVAMAAHGGGITAEAADIVLLADDPAGIADVIEIGKKTVRVANQSIWIGLGLSGAAIVVAVLGHVTPTVGAVFQEVVDVVAILNALRAAR